MRRIHDKMLRGQTRMGWLDSFHSFSFGSFSDPARMGLGPLRVVNEDFIIPGAGFAPHDHADMDILTYVLSGRIAHEDSLGHRAELGPDELQMMTAGSGITHAEMNPSETEGTHLYQIWIMPDAGGGAPAYQQLALDPDLGRGALAVIASGRQEAPVRLNSGTDLYRARLVAGDAVPLAVAPGRHGFAQILSGIAEVEGERLSAGDALEFRDTAPMELVWQTAGEMLFFDLPR
ncbi:pirin family protein [Phaeovulum sp. W22_SRMD_FR3]|uniref:pirin family protein n=1 Tax=Phaeovulum sp. W22_SRMD_FR3 TaxID=3240274 RepID=UPI003F98F048